MLLSLDPRAKRFPSGENLTTCRQTLGIINTSALNNIPNLKNDIYFEVYHIEIDDIID